MSYPVKHSKKCRTSFPRCPCNTCAQDIIDNEGRACCIKRRKKCEQPCSDYIDEREDEGFERQE